MDQTPALKNRLRAEQMLALFENVALGVIGAAAAALVLASAMIHLGALDWNTGVSWISYIFACAAAHLLLRHFYYRIAPDDDQWKIWAVWFTAISLAEGIGWGWASVSLVGDSGRFSLELLVMVVTLNIAGGAIPAFSSYCQLSLPCFCPPSFRASSGASRRGTCFPKPYQC